MLQVIFHQLLHLCYCFYMLLLSMHYTCKMAVASWLLIKVVFYSVLLILLDTNDNNNKSKQLNNIRENYRAAGDLSRPVFNNICCLKHRQSTLFMNSTAYYKATKAIRVTRDVLLVMILNLCGDVASNPGPVRLIIYSRHYQKD